MKKKIEHSVSKAFSEVDLVWPRLEGEDVRDSRYWFQKLTWHGKFVSAIDVVIDFIATLEKSLRHPASPTNHGSFFEDEN